MKSLAACCRGSRLAFCRVAIAAPYNQAQTYVDLAALQVRESDGLGIESATIRGSHMLAISSSQRIKNKV